MPNNDLLDFNMYEQSLSFMGQKGTGTYSTEQTPAPKVESLTVTENGDYSAADQGLDGYSTVSVNVSGGTNSGSDVVFYDYDGSVLYSYSAEDFLALTEMPANYTYHEGFTAQGWNWSLANAKSYVSTFGKLSIGQMCITSDGIFVLKGYFMWRENLIQLKKSKGISSKQIAELCNVPEKTVVRIFNGSTPNPTIDNILAIVHALGGSLDSIFDIFAGTGTLISDENLTKLQMECNALKEENSRLNQELINAQLQINNYALETKYLKNEIELKDEIISIHKAYLDYLGKNKNEKTVS